MHAPKTVPWNIGKSQSRTRATSINVDTLVKWSGDLCHNVRLWDLEQGKCLCLGYVVWGWEGPTTQLKLDELPPDPFVQPAWLPGVRYIMSGHAATIRGVACLHLAAQRLRVRETPSLRKQLMR